LKWGPAFLSGMNFDRRGARRRGQRERSRATRFRARVFVHVVERERRGRGAMQQSRRSLGIRSGCNLGIRVLAGQRKRLDALLEVGAGAFLEFEFSRAREKSFRGAKKKRGLSRARHKEFRGTGPTARARPAPLAPQRFVSLPSDLRARGPPRRLKGSGRGGGQ
jgi:hypothetical protein